MSELIGTWCDRGTLAVSGNTTAETTVDTTPRKIGAFATSVLASGVTVSTANDNIVIADAGDYLVLGSVSFSGTISATYNIEIYKNTAATGLVLERKLGTGGDTGNSGVQGIVTCAASDAISLYQYTADGSIMTVRDAQLTVIRLS